MTGPAPDPAGPASDPTTDRVPARPAATVVILRDGGEGIEAFMVVRHRAIAFAAGALVFPGGKVDPGDADGAWGVLAPVSATPPLRSGYVAAARESFEEAGLMLARGQGAADLLSAAATHELVDRHRANLIAGKISFLDIVRRERLTLATDLMVPFAHWITPEGVPKRFDTHFLLVAAPVNQLGAHDGSEFHRGLVDPAAAGLGRGRDRCPHLGVCHTNEPDKVGALRHRRGGNCGGAGKPGRHRDAAGRATLRRAPPAQNSGGSGLWGERNRGDRAAGHAAGLNRRAVWG